MESYRLTASALLRLASIAGTAPGADAAEILTIVQSAQPDPAGLPRVEAGPYVAGEDADKPAKPE